MNPYLRNPHRDDEFLIPKKDGKGTVVHCRRRRHPRSEKDDNRFFIAIGIVVAIMYAWMLIDWINAPL
jgi:hypothetical protein